ncbi:MAG: hypothetical protein ACO1OB_28090 [Archangium sp.]
MHMLVLLALAASPGEVKVFVDPTGLSNPPGRIEVLLVGTNLPTRFHKRSAFELKPGTYRVMDVGQRVVFAEFKVEPSEVSANREIVPDVSKLTALDIDPTALAGAMVRLSTVDGKPGGERGLTGAFTSTVRVFLPNGHYVLTTYSTQAKFGRFDIERGVASRTEGGLVIAGGAITFDRQKYTSVKFVLSALASGGGAQAVFVRDRLGQQEHQGVARLTAAGGTGGYRRARTTSASRTMTARSASLSSRLTAVSPRAVASAQRRTRFTSTRRSRASLWTPGRSRTTKRCGSMPTKPTTRSSPSTARGA